MDINQLNMQLKELDDIMSKVDFLAPFRKTLMSLKEKLKEGRLNAVFVGEFNSGKTSLINSLFGLDLPTNVLPETATIWRIYIANVDKPVIEVNTIDGQKHRVEDFQEAKSYDPKQVKFIDVFIYADVDEGITIVDTPGLSSLETHHQEVLKNFIDEADVLLVTVDINQGITKSLKQFIETGLKEKRRTYVIITKADTKPGKSSQELKRYILSEFPDFIDDVIIVSAKNGSLGELKKLLEKISQEKERIIAESVERKLKSVCFDASEVVKKQIENANLDISEIKAKMNDLLSKLEQIDKEIRELLKKAEMEIDSISNKASEVFISSLMQRVNWIAEGLYDENLSETIEHRFDKAIKEAAREAVEAIQEDIENLLAQIESTSNELAQKYDIGKNVAITLSEYVVNLREFLADLITALLSRIPKIGSFALVAREILKSIISEALKLVTKSFVINKIKETIADSSLKDDFRYQMKNMLSETILNSYKDELEELEVQKQAYKLSYEELKEEKKKKEEEFLKYIENLKYINERLTLCGGRA